MEIEQKVIDEARIEDFPQINQALAKKLGIDAFIKLALAAGGTTIYIPKADSLLQPARDRVLKQEFNGTNYKELALKYNLSETWVRNVINLDQQEKAQTKLFDVINQ